MNVDVSARRLRRDAQGSPLSAGFIGGTTLTEGFPEKEGFQGRSTRMVGVAFELHVTRSFGVEADILYHPLILSERARATVVTWEIPFLAKYRFRGEGWHPFLAAGPTFRASGNRNATNPSILGAAVGGGVEFHKTRWAFAPTLRYVRWTKDDPSDYSPASSNQNQVQLLFTIRFPAN